MSTFTSGSIERRFKKNDRIFPRSRWILPIKQDRSTPSTTINDQECLCMCSKVISHSDEDKSCFCLTKGDVSYPTKITKRRSTHPSMTERWPHLVQGLCRHWPGHSATYCIERKSDVTNKQLKNTLNTLITIEHLNVSVFSTWSLQRLTKTNDCSCEFKCDLKFAQQKRW